MFSQRILVVAIATITVAPSSAVMAAAFQLNYQSTDAISLANAGRATLTDNASVIYTNPAGLSRLNGHQASINASGIFPQTNISNTSSTNSKGSAAGDAVDNTVLGSAFWAIPATGEALSAGVGFYQPFGFNADYENGYIGRYWGDQSELKILTLQPTISYAINDKVSLGAGFTVNYIDGTLSRNMLSTYDAVARSAQQAIQGGADPQNLPPLSQLAASTGQLNATQKLEGDDIAYGWNLGGLWNVNDQLRIGAVYRSEVDYKVEGHVEFSNLPATVAGALGLPFASGRYNAQLNLTTPESYELSASYDASPSTTLHTSWIRTNWSTLKKLPIRIDGTAIGALNTSEALDYRDTDLYSIGVSWKQTDQLNFRAGIAHDEAVTNSHPSARVPTGARMLYTLGAGYQFTPKASVDVAYIYAKEDRTNVDANNVDSGNYQATFQNSANIVSAQLNYKF
jgi:long-chain fatty acid transport protein